MWLCVAGLVFSFLSSPASVAYAGEPLPVPIEPTERPVLVPGERWVYTNHVQRFLREENELLVFDTALPKERFYFTKDLNQVKYTEEKEPGKEEIKKGWSPHSGFLRFPLRLGQSWSHRYTKTGKRKSSSKKVRQKVTGYERITVQGREYDAYRIEGIDRRTDRLYGVRITIWYAPEVKNWVKFVVVNEYTGEELSGRSFELERYEPVE